MRSMEGSTAYKQSGSNTRLEMLLRVALVLILIIVITAAGYFLLKFFQERNRPPRTYYEYQLAIWKNTLSRYPKSPDVHTNLGYVYLKMGEEARGLEYFNSALKIDKNFAPALYNLGLYHRKKGNYKPALKYLKKAGKFSSDGNKYLTYFTIGEIYEKQGKPDDAISAFEMSAEDNGSMWNTSYKLGRLYEKKGDAQLALENYKKAALFNPDHEQLKKAITRLSEKGSE